mmetsp:Transcript_9611/g.14189  ORF Transcript_9611/g.14189 Transcript_9611/m.14189 type:complete len:238 (-) Transcript_9611:3315-4028(-)
MKRFATKTSRTAFLKQLSTRGYTLRINDTVPNFQSKTQLGEFDLYDYLGNSWGILFSHPKDYTPVCASELAVAANLNEEWEKRKTKVVALSVDSVEDHESWIKDINGLSEGTVNYPIIADEDKSVSKLYNMLPAPEEGQKEEDIFTVRSVFIIDPKKRLKLQMTYPATSGRNFDELIRVLDSIQKTYNKPLATPVNWKVGDDLIIAPTVTNEQAEKMFPKGFKEQLPYLRYTPDPDL